MSAQHSHTPWSAPVVDGRLLITDRDGRRLFEIEGADMSAIGNRRNADRLAVCVNACAEIERPQGMPRLVQLVTELDRFTTDPGRWIEHTDDVGTVEVNGNDFRELLGAVAAVIASLDGVAPLESDAADESEPVTFEIDENVVLGEQVQPTPERIAELDAIIQGPPVVFDWSESLTDAERDELDENADELLLASAEDRELDELAEPFEQAECNACNGHGEEPNGNGTCEACAGRGWHRVPYADERDENTPQTGE